MGYETRIHIVRQYRHDPQYGNELATIDLSKCGDDAVAQLIAKHIKKAKSNPEPFCLWPNEPDRQREAVEFLRDVASVEENIVVDHCVLKKDELDKLANDLEGGKITKDKYGDPLPVIDIDEFIAALEEDLKIDNYRRFKWALVLLKTIKETWPEGDLKVVCYGH